VNIGSSILLVTLRLPAHPAFDAVVDDEVQRRTAKT